MSMKEGITAHRGIDDDNKPMASGDEEKGRRYVIEVYEVWKGVKQ